MRPRRARRPPRRSAQSRRRAAATRRVVKAETTLTPQIAYDARDLGDVDEDRVTPKLTLMEEVLLLGLKVRMPRTSDLTAQDKQGYLCPSRMRNRV